MRGEVIVTLRLTNFKFDLATVASCIGDLSALRFRWTEEDGGVGVVGRGSFPQVAVVADVAVIKVPVAFSLVSLVPYARDGAFFWRKSRGFWGGIGRRDFLRLGYL